MVLALLGAIVPAHPSGGEVMVSAAASLTDVLQQIAKLYDLRSGDKLVLNQPAGHLEQGESLVAAVAREALEVYAPLAHRLGIHTIKWELEDLAFQTLHPRKYVEIQAMVNQRRAEREKYVEAAGKTLERELQKVGIPAEIASRAKHFYSIYEKMVKRGKEFNEIYDLVGIRVIVGESVPPDLGFEYLPRHIVPEEVENLPGGAGRIFEISGLVPFLEPPTPFLGWSVRFDPAQPEFRAGHGVLFRICPEAPWVPPLAPYLPTLRREAVIEADQLPGRIWSFSALVEVFPEFRTYFPALRRETAPPATHTFVPGVGVKDTWRVPRGGKLWTVPEACR